MKKECVLNNGDVVKTTTLNETMIVINYLKSFGFKGSATKKVRKNGFIGLDDKEEICILETPSVISNKYTFEEFTNLITEDETQIKYEPKTYNLCEIIIAYPAPQNSPLFKEFINNLMNLKQ